MEAYRYLRADHSHPTAQSSNVPPHLRDFCNTPAAPSSFPAPPISAAASTTPNLDVSAVDILVMQSAGPIGGPGMPEAGFMPLPRKILAQGIRDMVRISDARMSGTAFGTVVLHVSPESAIGGPLALVHDGDMIYP